jgi:hypothetical protein
VILAALALAQAAAPGWTYVSTSTVGSRLYYDRSTIQRTGHLVRAWVRIDHSHDRTTRARETKEMWSYDCTQRTTLAITSISYLPNGVALDARYLHDDPYDYTPVIPQSQADTVMRLLCP